MRTAKTGTGLIPCRRTVARTSEKTKKAPAAANAFLPPYGTVDTVVRKVCVMWIIKSK